MKKKFVRLISAVLSAAMTLTAVPLSAFAEGEVHTHDGESNVITTPLDFREKTADENGVGWSWDYDTKTLTLDGVNIQATTDSKSVVTVPDGTEIVLNGNNTIVQTNTDDSDTYVLSAVNTDTTNCDGTMTISGDGVLNAENRSTDSMARSLGGTIILNGGTVNATGTVKTNSLEIHNDGVLNANATTASFEGVAVNVSRGITVDGNGSLTAVGCANESTLNSAILLTSNFDKISVSENGSITVPEGNAARVGIYYSGNNGDGMDAEISGGKVTAYGTKYGIYKVNLIMSGTGSVYTTGGSYAIGQTLPEIDMDELIVRGSADFKAEESAVTGEVKYNSGYYEIGGADAKTVVIKPDTSPRIILGKQTGIFKTEEYEIIEGETDTKLKGTVYFDITLKNMSDKEFADARGYFGGDEPDLSASIIKNDYGWVCMVCDTEFSVTYDTDNTLTIKCGDIVSNTVQVKSNANRFNKVTQGDNTNRTVFYTNTSQEEKDNYKLVSTYTVDSESISYNWYSTNSAYSADELGAAVSGSNGEFKLADNIPAGNYVLYCDITYSDGDSTETVTEKFTFTYKECAHENGYSDGKCTNCGALCDHSDIDIDTGKCNECAHQLVATISTDGSAPTGYDTLADCLDSITADTGNYVKIYQDIGDASATAILDTIDVKHNVMIDLNGHKLNNIKLGVNKDVTLTLTGTAGSYVTQVYVRKGGGSFIIDSEANVEFNTIFVEDSARLAVNDGAKVTTEQLTVIASVNDDGTTTTSVKLATGMKLGGLTYHRQNNSGVLKLGNLLDVTRQALRREDNGNYLDLYKEYGSMGYSVALTVVGHTDADHKYSDGTGKCEECGKPCEHGGDINTDNGICSVCGAVVSVALYTDGDGNLSSYLDADELHSLLNEYNGSGTIKLFKDYDNSKAQYDLYGELTIDLNGRRLNIRSITPCKNGKLTIKNSGNPVMLGCNVYPTNDASYAGGTLIIDGDVVLDTSIYVYDSSTVILKDGAYTAGLYARDSKTLYDMLGEGKAFFKTDGTLFNASVKEISSSVTLIVKDHSHTYVDGKCECGYVCPHSDVDSKTGKCTECEYQYAVVIVKDGAVASVYKETEMEAAFETADSDANTGCTLRVYKNYTGSYRTLSGKFTLWIAEKANVGTLTVSGDITVTGSKKNNRIYGDFNVAAGGKLTFDENCGAMGTVSVGAGTFDCYSTFAITLNINDASSNVILHGGAFKTICYNGGGDRANAEILTLLAENRMFMKSPNPEPIDGSKTLLKDGFATTVIVIPHEDHSYDSTTGKCTICGKRCGHTDVDSKTGVCLTCEYQLTAGISGVGTAKYFDNIDNAFTAASSAENSGCTLTLYKDCELSQNIVIGNATVTVDMNGHSILLAYRIKVNDGGVLYLKNSRENGSIDTEIEVNKGGTLINGTADDSSSAVSVFSVYADAAKCVEIYGGSCTGLTVNNGTSGIALYGGSYELIHTNDLTDSTPVSALLAKGYAFVTLNSVTHLPESIVDGSATNLNPGLENVMVVKHTHTYNETDAKCACGAYSVAMFTESTTGNITFITTVSELKELTSDEQRAGVIKLTEDISNSFSVYGEKTIDFNGHKVSGAITQYNNVIFANSSSNRAEIANTVYVCGNLTVNGDILFSKSFYVNFGGNAILNFGTFKKIYVPSGMTVLDLLPNGTALAKFDAEGVNAGLYDAGVRTASEENHTLKIVAHPEHDYDEDGKCGCGYQCAHDDVDTKAGVCRECNTKIYAAITVKSETGTTVKYFTKLTEAFEFAAKNENKGCTLKMLRAFSDSNTDINVDGGVLTVDMNGFGVNIHSFNGSGTKITIRSDSKCTFGVENGFSMDGGTVTFSGEVSVVCQNVKLNATYFSSYVEMLDIDTLILEDGVPLKQLARITNANIANINCSSEIYLYQILASGSCVDSQLYSDLKANASSNFDNVRIIRCDHPDGVGRDNRCIYCNSLIAASVSYTENGAEKTEYFVKEDLGKAFAKANSVASATITMLMSSAYDTDYLNVTGDVTLIANGDNAILYNTVKVADGGKLTLRGNANIFAVIAEPGSRLTAEEATRIAYLTVNGGDVKLSGGQYDNITVKDGKITDILADGYAYKKTEGGAWLTLKEREVSEASGVTVTKAPIVKATLSTEINKLYRNSNANPTLKFNLALAHGSNLNDSYVSKRYGINSYVSGDIIYSSLSALVKDAKLSADEIIDKAGDSDAAKIYFVVTTGDGYEIKSNTVSIDLVDCDHSQVVDPTADKETAGNITTPTYCEICESKFNAKITKGDDVRYYNDLDEAAKDAQKRENEGCTLYPLYNKNGYGGQLVITEGNFTLKYAVRTAFSRPIIINGKAKLTVTGRCAVTAFENQDAFIVRGGDVTFDGLATGSNVTINGGNVTMAANNINCLTIHGGNVSISSGGFAEIVTTVSDKVIADYIDHGFWVQDRGTKEWIDIYSLNKATASSTNVLSVRLCPMQIIKPIDTVYYTNGYYPDGIPSLQISAEPWYSGEVDAKVAYQWIAIDENGYETVIEGATDRKLSLENLTTGRYYCRLTYSNATTAGVSMKSDVVTATITECEHSGGEATCTEKAKCEICGAEYGEPLGHEYIETVVAPTYTSKGYTVFECTRCKHKYNGNFVPVKPIPDVEEIAVEKMTYDEVDISWKNISGVDGYYVEGYVGNQWTKFSFSTDGDSATAKLSGLSAGLKYKVRIAAYAGRFTGKFRYFYVDTVPSPVWNINTVKATDETVRISWNRNTRADGYKVEWYIDNQWSVKTVTGNNNIAAVIDGLCAGTRYKVRVSAYKGDLYSPYTYGYINTLPSKVTGIMQTVTSSSFTLTWDKNESADGYTVQYYADGKWNEKTLTGNSKTAVTIGSLKGYKTYKVRIKAYKGELQSAFDDIYITTAPSKVSGLKVKSAVDSKAVVIWNADTNADGYNVGYYIGGKWVEKTITDNKTAMAELDGLTPYSTYKVRVRAYKGKLYGDYSYTTVSAVLSQVTDIKVVSAKSNSITVKWGKNASADGYKVEIYKGGKWVKKTLKGSTNATVTIGGLRAGSVYKVRIASYNGANTSTYTYANVNTAK